ncbi:exocyst complex component EXO70A1-like [Olea europaea var. sylvestris]|uniref:exocyst complex component EXO70A1-like n=1 Tax=Olea europaea var. sylvestris TaxID=158386 RepID=UPI000C1CD1BA|nr:exocyst complex component EXO70A1-like [Olea europaea var. sylvestris]
MDPMTSTISYQSAVDTIYHWHHRPVEQLIFDCGESEITRYLEAVDRIQQSLTNGTESDDLNSIAMARLKHEFLKVLTTQSDPFGTVDSITSDWSSLASTGYEDYSSVYNLPSDEEIFYLRHVAERLNSGGHLGDCIELYKRERKSFFYTMIIRLRLEELYAFKKKRFLWEELKVKIEMWIRVARVCFCIVFDFEKQISEKLFSGFGNGASEECFWEIVGDSANNLLVFAETVSSSNQSSERMGTILGLYDTLLFLLLKIDTRFDFGAAEAIRKGVKETVSQLENNIRRMLLDFEKAVFRELSTIQDDRGAIHPLTKRVMNYISLIVSSKKLLTDLIISMPPLKFEDQLIPEGELGDLKGRSHLALHLILIIVVLQLNLKGKSEKLNHVPLRHLFMMNNVHYIVEKIEESKELREIIGDDYMEKLNTNVMQAMTSYQVSTCDQFLSCFREEGLYVTWCFSTQVSKRALRKRLKAFNSVFEEIQTLHTNWIVRDSELLNELRASMVDKLIPAYKKFHAEVEKHREIHKKYFQHSFDDLEALVSKNLFSYYEIIV